MGVTKYLLYNWDDPPSRRWFQHPFSFIFPPWGDDPIWRVHAPFFSLRGWWKTTKKGWKKTDFAALGGDLFLFLGYSGPCQVGDEVSFTCVTWMKIINRRAIYSLGVLQYIFRWVFLPFQLCNRLKNTGGLTQPGCWFCIYVNAQACYATCCKSQLFFPNSYLPCLVGGFK